MEISIEANSNMGNQMGKENFKHQMDQFTLDNFLMDLSMDMENGKKIIKLIQIYIKVFI